MVPPTTDSFLPPLMVIVLITCSSCSGYQEYRGLHEPGPRGVRSTISATRPVPVTDDAYPYPYP